VGHFKKCVFTGDSHVVAFANAFTSAKEVATIRNAFEKKFPGQIVKSVPVEERIAGKNDSWSKEAWQTTVKAFTTDVRLDPSEQITKWKALVFLQLIRFGMLRPDSIKSATGFSFEDLRFDRRDTAVQVVAFRFTKLKTKNQADDNGEYASIFVARRSRIGECLHYTLAARASFFGALVLAEMEQENCFNSAFCNNMDTMLNELALEEEVTISNKYGLKKNGEDMFLGAPPKLLSLRAKWVTGKQDRTMSDYKTDEFKFREELQGASLSASLEANIFQLDEDMECVDGLCPGFQLVARAVALADDEIVNELLHEVFTGPHRSDTAFRYIEENQNMFKVLLVYLILNHLQFYKKDSQGGIQTIPLRQHVVDALETFLGGYCNSLVVNKSLNTGNYFHLYRPGSSSASSVPGSYLIISKLQARVAELEEHAAKLKDQLRSSGLTPYDSDQETVSFSSGLSVLTITKDDVASEEEETGAERDRGESQEEEEEAQKAQKTERVVVSASIIAGLARIDVERFRVFAIEKAIAQCVPIAILLYRGCGGFILHHANSYGLHKEDFAITLWFKSKNRWLDLVKLMKRFKEHPGLIEGDVDWIQEIAELKKNSQFKGGNIKFVLVQLTAMQKKN